MPTKSLKEQPTPWICRISRLSSQFIGREMGRLGFGPGQFYFLSELYVEDGISQDELSRRVGVDKSNTSRALAKLEEYGLIYRQANPDNHKEKMVYLQQKALEIRSDFRKIQHRWNANLLMGVSEGEKGKLLSSLKKMAENAESAFVEDYIQAPPRRRSNSANNHRRIQPMDLLNILSKEEWVRFEKELFDLFEINCTVYDNSGARVTPTTNWCNRLCPQIKGNKNSLAAICAPGNQNFMAQARQIRKPIVGECDAGLMKIAVPIFVNDTFLGAAGGCGLLPEGGKVETFMIEKSLGLSEEEIADLCRGMGSMTEERGWEMATFIENRIAQHVGRCVDTSVSPRR